SFTAVIGKNGSGKSTLAKNFNGLLLPTGGVCYVAGYDTKNEDTIWNVRQTAGMVFQNPDNQLVSSVVEDDVAFGPENLGVPPEEIRARVDDSLKRVHMYDERLKAPHLLSGGQKQRIAIAGVVAMKPRCIILDEPTAMLDPQGRSEVMDIIHRFHKEGITIVLITHFMEEAALADRVIVFDAGKIVLDGTPEEVFSREKEIRALSLSVPFPIKLAGRLRNRGAEIPDGLITDELLADYIAKNRKTLRAPGKAPYREEEITFERKDGKPLIEVRNLVHIYNENLPYETRAVDDVSFDVAEGAFVGIIGHTGSGKSTLIQELNGLLKPKSGRILVDGVDVTDPKTSLRDVRKKVGLVFQYPEYQLFEETVEKDIGFGPKNLGLSEEEIKERVKEALRLVDLDYDEVRDRSPFDLSGGQKRRVAIAGVVAMRPKVLILDEPTAGLDPQSKRAVLAMIENLRHEEGMTILLVSHNMGDIGILADRVLVMDRGKLALEGTPEEVFAKVETLKELRLGLPPAAEFKEVLKEKLRETDAEGLARLEALEKRTTLTLWQAEDLLCEWLNDGTAVPAEGGER
ncbi:MAG: energy-coupling factor transporter ATPase, partial [Firmicutes bacterium]|nr:energy-coupling factor transporter ATPase [Bacillota bacterium]